MQKHTTNRKTLQETLDKSKVLFGNFRNSAGIFLAMFKNFLNIAWLLTRFSRFSWKSHQIWSNVQDNPEHCLKSISILGKIFKICLKVKRCSGNSWTLPTKSERCSGISWTLHFCSRASWTQDQGFSQHPERKSKKILDFVMKSYAKTCTNHAPNQKRTQNSLKEHVKIMQKHAKTCKTTSNQHQTNMRKSRKLLNFAGFVRETLDSFNRKHQKCIDKLWQIYSYSKTNHQKWLTTIWQIIICP